MDCPDGNRTEYCLRVEGIGMLGVTHISETVYEGTLTGDAINEAISVVVIRNPEGNSALVCIFETDLIRTDSTFYYIFSTLCTIFMYHCLTDQFPTP